MRFVVFRVIIFWGGSGCAGNRPGNVREGEHVSISVCQSSCCCIRRWTGQRRRTQVIEIENLGNHAFEVARTTNGVKRMNSRNKELVHNLSLPYTATRWLATGVRGCSLSDRWSSMFAGQVRMRRYARGLEGEDRTST